MKRIDLQDVLLVIGIGSIIWGVYMCNHAAAAITFGLFCLLGVRNIANRRSVVSENPKGRA